METDVLSPPVFDGSFCGYPGDLPPGEAGVACETCPLRAANFDLRQQVGYYQTQHQRTRQREDKLKQEVAELQAKLRLRERQLFGRKSEKGNSRDQNQQKNKNQDKAKKARGQQPGSQGHPRQDYSHLPVEEEICKLPEDQCQCPECGLPLEDFPGTEDSEQIEIDVRAHRRVIRRRRYRPACRCNKLPGIVTAPGPAKLIPKGLYGISVWTTVLLDKYCFLRPTWRLIEDLKSHGLKLSMGTITDGLQRLGGLFEPIMTEINRENWRQKQWHADETRWKMFCEIVGKVGPNWYFWVFESCSAVAFVLAPCRAAKVPEAYFAGVEEGVLIVDRYSAYKAMAKVKLGKIRLAFCWTHVRRDFLDVAKDWPSEESWGMDWVGRIGELFHLNDLRLKAQENPTAFAEQDQKLRQSTDRMARQCEEELGQSNLHPARRKALESLRNHWEGLTLFVDRPEIPMDNSEAERQMRPLAVCRKIFYGSFSLWSGQLAARMFSLFATLRLWKLNPRKWLTAYLRACAENGGQPPPDAKRFLPWNLSEDDRLSFAEEPAVEDSS